MPEQPTNPEPEFWENGLTVVSHIHRWPPKLYRAYVDLCCALDNVVSAEQSLVEAPFNTFTARDHLRACRQTAEATIRELRALAARFPEEPR